MTVTLAYVSYIRLWPLYWKQDHMENTLFRNLSLIVLFALSLQLLSACASYGTISNQPIADPAPSAR